MHAVRKTEGMRCFGEEGLIDAPVRRPAQHHGRLWNSNGNECAVLGRLRGALLVGLVACLPKCKCEMIGHAEQLAEMDAIARLCDQMRSLTTAHSGPTNSILLAAATARHRARQRARTAGANSVRGCVYELCRHLRMDRWVVGVYSCIHLELIHRLDRELDRVLIV
jgi:hypothetical protein